VQAGRKFLRFWRDLPSCCLQSRRKHVFYHENGGSRLLRNVANITLYGVHSRAQQSLIYFVWISKLSDSQVRLKRHFKKCHIDPHALSTPPPPYQGHKHKMSLFNFAFLSILFFFFYFCLSFFVSFLIHTAGQNVNVIYSPSFWLGRSQQNAQWSWPRQLTEIRVVGCAQVITRH
jgi:hypothetical protein